MKHARVILVPVVSQGRRPPFGYIPPYNPRKPYIVETKSPGSNQGWKFHSRHRYKRTAVVEANKIGGKGNNKRYAIPGKGNNKRYAIP